MIYIAINPGLTGAIAAIDDAAQITVERSQPMPAQGVSSTFTTGVVLGSILAACQRIAMPLHLVTAAVWKRSMGLNASKSVSLDRARLLFPTASLARVKDHNRAESLLLAEYSRRAFNGAAKAERGAVSGALEVFPLLARPFRIPPPRPGANPRRCFLLMPPAARTTVIVQRTPYMV